MILQVKVYAFNVLFNILAKAESTQTHTETCDWKDQHTALNDYPQSRDSAPRGKSLNSKRLL